jgi:hypothetical protein
LEYASVAQQLSSNLFASQLYNTARRIQKNPQLQHYELEGPVDKLLFEAVHAFMKVPRHLYHIEYEFFIKFT